MWRCSEKKNVLYRDAGPPLDDALGTCPLILLNHIFNICPILTFFRKRFFATSPETAIELRNTTHNSKQQKYLLSE